MREEQPNTLKRIGAMVGSVGLHVVGGLLVGIVVGSFFNMASGTAAGAGVVAIIALWMAWDAQNSADHAQTLAEEAIRRLGGRQKDCPFCGAILKTDLAQQCVECGADWHDPTNIVKGERRTS